MADIAEAPVTEQKQTAEKPRPRKGLLNRIRSHPLKFIAFLIFLGVAAVAGMRLWAYLDSYESTDDAQIDGDVYPVTSRIAGTLKAVYVDDNQAVKAGQLLAELDPRDYAVALDQARESQTQVSVAQPNVPITSQTTQTTIATAGSELETASAQLAAAEGDYRSALADVRSAEADNAKAQADLNRYKQLVAKDEISRQQYDQAEATANATLAKVDAKRATAEAAARNIEAQRSRLQQAQTVRNEAETNRPNQIAIQNATVQNRRAMAEVERTRVARAELDLSYTKIFAPVDGIVGRKSVAPGQQVSPGQQLMLDVPLARLWVTANFKETQLKKMHPGQRATVHVDAYDRD
jgi:membrane fusion protein (multidrug efflux system)